MHVLRMCLSVGASLSFFFLSAQSENTPSPSPSVRESEIQYLEMLMQGNNRLAFDLYHALQQPSGNFCFSSYSIVEGLTRVALGAKGETAQQFQHAFRYSLSLIPLMGDLNDLLQTPSSKANNASQITLANALWLQKDLPVLPSFKQTLKRDFKITLQFVDFAQQPSRAIQIINEWVAQQTNRKINNILTPQDVTGNTRLVLTTAMSIKGQWAHLFDQKQTKRLAFHSDSQRNTVADMMHTTATYLLWKGEKWDLLVLPYEQGSQGAQLAMLILLPKENSLEELEKSLTWDNWRQWMSQLQMQVVDLTLPRFRLEKRLDLETGLKALGLSVPFSAEADFAGITAEKIQLNKAVHKTFVRVDERGTDATATAVAIEKPAELKEGEIPYPFIADHPFLFVIWEQKTNSILWMGRLVLP